MTAQEKNIQAIAKEMNIATDKIANVVEWDGYLRFDIGGAHYTNKLTATGKHKKNSVRFDNY